MNLLLQRIWRITRRVLRVLLVIWMVLVVVLTFVQRKLMYRPLVAHSLPVAESRSMGVYPFSSDVTILSGNKRIGGWWLRAEDSMDRPLVILFHGNAGNRAGRTGWYELLSGANCDVLAIDYQGYGDSEGRPSQAAIESDAEATWSFATRELKYDPSRVILMGISLGGAAAVHVAAQQSIAGSPPGGLVAVATFSSMVDVAAAHYSWVPVRAVLLDKYPSADKIPHVTAPVLQLHGDRDRIVEEKFGRQLFEKTRDRSAVGITKRWVTLEGAGHNDILHRHGSLILDEIATFVGSSVNSSRMKPSGGVESPSKSAASGVGTNSSRR